MHGLNLWFLAGSGFFITWNLDWNCDGFLAFFLGGGGGGRVGHLFAVVWSSIVKCIEASRFSFICIMYLGKENRSLFRGLGYVISRLHFIS